MDVSTSIVTVNGENKIKVTIDTGGYVSCKNQYFKVFDANGNAVIRFPADGYYGAGSETRTFILEDQTPGIIALYPNSKAVSFYVEHHQENTFIGWRRVDTKHVTCTLVDNSATRPSISMTSSLLDLVNGYNMKGKTKVLARFSGGAKYGASVSSYKLKIEGKEYAASGGEATSEPFGTSGSVTITGIVTDSRGFTASVSEEVVVLNNLPTMDSFLCSTGYLDGTIGYGFTPPVSLYYSKVRIESVADGVASEVRTETIGASAGAVSRTLAFTDEQLEAIYVRYPATVHTTLRATLLTYKDSAYTDKMSEEPLLELSLDIPQNDNTLPSIDSVSCVPSEIVLGQSDLFVPGKNGIKTTIEATGKYGTGIEWKQWYIFGLESGVWHNSGESSDIVKVSGTVQIHAIIRDQRGFQRAITKNVRFEEYLPPAVVPADGYTEVIAERVEGEETDTLRIAAAMHFSSLKGHNRCNLQCYGYKNAACTQIGFSQILLNEDDGTNNYDQIIEINLAKDVNYYVRIQVVDSLGNGSRITIIVPSEAVFMDRNGADNSIAFGGRSTKKNAVQIYQDAYFHGDVVFERLKEDGEIGVWRDIKLIDELEGGICRYQIMPGGKHVCLYIYIDHVPDKGALPLQINAERLPVLARPLGSIDILLPGGGGSVAHVGVINGGEIMLEWTDSVSYISGYAYYPNDN